LSLGAWLKSLFGRKRKRDISRLQPGAISSADEIENEAEEWVDLSGGPLKEKHQRRALRDKRLLPKIKSPARQLGISKRKTIIPRDEADRLFAGTMRTLNRNLRDLLTDEEQLQRLGLPVWRTEDDLAATLGISRKELWFFSIHRERERQPHYISFAIPKRSGGKRVIMAPKRRLKAIQRKLLELLVEKLPVSDCAHAFRRGRNIRTGAEPHVGKRAVLKLDLKDFFPTVTAARVRGLLIACGYSFSVATTLAVIMTEAERQPVEVDGTIFHVPVGERHCVQGAPTSPGICNAILLKMDRRLAGFARKNGLSYTRYADDLSFSGEMDRATANKYRATVTRIVSEEGFQINAEKTRWMNRGSRQSVTGVIVNQTLGLSRQERRRMRAAAHHLRQQAASVDHAMKCAQLKGKVAYLAMLNPAQAAPFHTRMPD
jgi:RNA-directed DNA polymerase